MTVLAYHKVDNKFELGLTNVKPKIFYRQVSELMRYGYEITDSAEVAAATPKNVCLTFDDGYDCFYRNAVPFLISFRAKASVFVITDFIGKTNKWDLRLSYQPFIHMDASQLKEISKLGFEVGSHSRSHKDLTRLDPNLAKSELSDSKKFLEDLLGKEVSSISFPYGRHNAVVADLAREAGYTKLFGLGSAVHDGVIGRIPVYRLDSPAAVRRKVSMNKFEIFKSDFIHSFANVSALISVRRTEKIVQNERVDEHDVAARRAEIR